MYKPVSRDTTTAIQGKMAIREKIQHIRTRIERACLKANRDPQSVELIAVTKTYPIEIVREAFDAGIRHFGENRVQELKLKSQLLPGKHQGGEVFWHMIGHIQRNKARDVVACADYIHALDSLRLAAELDRRAGESGRVISCLVQVNVSNETSKFGLQPAELSAFFEKLTAFKSLRVSGLMTLASPAYDPETIRPQFQLLRRLLEEQREKSAGFERMVYLSMGMSGDFEVAIEEGATHVRVGSALFGART